MTKKIVDLFSGCGGFSLGADLAGFSTCIAIDIDSDLQSSFHKNFPIAKPVLADVTKLDGAFWKAQLGKMRPVGVVGGPPCQGFSRIGKRNPEDPRNTLIGHYFRQIGLLKPKFFVMENVEGLLDEFGQRTLAEALATLPSRYEVLGPMVINAADYGAPTDRRRVIVVGYDREDVSRLTVEMFSPVGNVCHVTVKDAIFDLPKPNISGKTHEGFSWKKYPDLACELSSYAVALRALPPEGLGWEPAIQMLRESFVTGVMPTEHSELVKERFAGVLPGAVDTVSRFPRLKWENRCPTLRAGTGKDRGSHQSMRPIHPHDPRVITAREAARLQGFPDWFVFHPTIWHSFRMIGNSVSPIVSKRVLETISPSVI